MKITTTLNLPSAFRLGFIGLFSFGAFSQVIAQTVPKHDHVIICMMENYDYSEIIGDVTDCPYINGLTTDPYGALFTNYFAIEHPSQPNYLDIFSGNNQGNTSDVTPTNYPYTVANLGAELIAKSYTFGGYSESLTSVGSQASTAGGTNGYARKHAPWTNWLGTGTNQIPSTVHMPFTSFPTSANYSTLPTVSFVVPNLGDDMHNGTAPTNKQAGDLWVKTNLDAYIQWAKTNNSLFIIVWDEDDNTGGSNQVNMTFVGQNVKAGNYSEKATHYRLLRTLEDMYGLGYAGGSSTEVPITDCWKSIATGISAVGNPENFVRVVPNPFTSLTVIKSANELRNAELKIFDALGREVESIKEINGFQITVNRNNLGSGLYYFSILQDQTQVSRGKLVVE